MRVQKKQIWLDKKQLFFHIAKAPWEQDKTNLIENKAKWQNLRNKVKWKL